MSARSWGSSPCIDRRRRKDCQALLWIVILRLLALVASVALVASCNNGIAPLVGGPVVQEELESGSCPSPDDVEMTTKLPKALPMSPSVSAGSIAGAFFVTPTGEAIYTMTLEVPRGRAGMQPEVSLIYDS